MNLGTNPTNKSELAPLKSESYEIDKFFINIDFSHEGKKFQVVIDRFMYLGRDEKGLINEYDVINQLEQLDRFKSYLKVALKDIKTYRIDKELAFETWYAKTSIKVRDNIVSERMHLKETQKVPASMFTGITKEDVKNVILKDLGHEPIYKNYFKEIENLKQNEELLEGFRRDLYSRSETLRSLSMWFNQEKKKVLEGRLEELRSSE